MRKFDRRQLRSVQNLIGISVADSADNSRIGERPLQSTVFSSERSLKRRQIGVEDLDSARIDGTQTLLALQNVQGSAPFGPGFCQYKRTIRKIESRKLIAASQLCSSHPPMQ